MTPFNLPASSPCRRTRHSVRWGPALLPRGTIASVLGGCPGRLTRVAAIPAQILDGTIAGITPPNDPGRQRRRHQGDIGRLRAAHDKRQRDATPVDQQAALAPIFFPDPWDSGRPPREPTGLCSMIRPGVAIATQSRPSRHMLSDPRPPEAFKEASRLPTQEMPMKGAGAAKAFLGEGFPLNSRA